MHNQRKTIKIFFAVTLSVLLTFILPPIFPSAEMTYTGHTIYLADDYCLTREDFYVAAAKIFLGAKVTDKNIGLPFEAKQQINPENALYIASLYSSGIFQPIQEDEPIIFNPNFQIKKHEAIPLLGKLFAKSSSFEFPFPADNGFDQYAKWFYEQGILSASPEKSYGAADNLTAREFAELTEKIWNFKERNRPLVHSLTGTGSRGYADGSNSESCFTQPYGVFHDENDNVIVLDTYNNLIRKINLKNTETLTGSISNMDDTGFPTGNFVDGTLKSALFNRPTSGVVNSNGDLIIADSANNAIRVISDGNAYTFCGTTAGHADGAYNAAKFNRPMAIAIDKNDNIYVADSLNNCIRKIDPKGNVFTIAGTPKKEGFANGEADKALFRAPSGIAISDDGSVIYVSDTGNHRIRKIENGKVSTIAGRAPLSDEDDNPLGGFKDGVASEAMFNLPVGLSLSNGVIIVADSGNNRIRAISSDLNKVTTIAGNGEPGDKDGNALSSMLSQPMSVFYYEKTLYIADTRNNKIKTMPFDASSLKY